VATAAIGGGVVVAYAQAAGAAAHGMTMCVARLRDGVLSIV
jgi:hypothetical protein